MWFKGNLRFVVSIFFFRVCAPFIPVFGRQIAKKTKRVDDFADEPWKGHDWLSASGWDTNFSDTVCTWIGWFSLLPQPASSNSLFWSIPQMNRVYFWWKRKTNIYFRICINPNWDDVLQWASTSNVDVPRIPFRCCISNIKCKPLRN